MVILVAYAVAPHRQLGAQMGPEGESKTYKLELQPGAERPADLPAQVSGLVRRGEEVWLGARSGRRGSLFSHRQGVWAEHIWTELGEASAQRLFPVDEKTFVCVWRNERDGASVTVTRHTEGKPITITHLGKRIEKPNLLACASGALLVTESGPDVIRIAPDGAATHLTIAPEHFRSRRDEEFGEAAESYAPVHAVEDAKERLWLWSYAFAPAFNRNYLKGFLTLKEGKLERPEIEGLEPKDAISAVVAFEQQVFVAKSGVGIFVLNGEKLELQRMRVETLPSFGRALTHVTQLLSAGGMLYAVAYPPPPELMDRTADPLNPLGHPGFIYHRDIDRVGALFRYRAEMWELVINGLDEYARFDSPQRAAFATPAGLFVSSQGGVPWLARYSVGAPPLRLDWRQCFRLRNATSFCQVSAEKWLAVDADGNLDEAPLAPAGERVKTLVRNVTTAGPLIRDAAGHVWGLRSGDRFTTWRKGEPQNVALPGPVAWRGFLRLFSDDRDQIWFGQTHGAVAVFSCANQRWRQFKSWDEAYEGQLPHGADIQLRAFPTADGAVAFINLEKPVYSEDGRIAASAGRRIHYFADGKWRAWTTAEITGKSGAGVRGYFDEDGTLCADNGAAVYAWSEEGGWKATGRKRVPPEQPPRDNQPPKPPADCPIPEPRNVMADAVGVIWLLDREGQLWKTLAGRTVEALDPEEPSPFRGKHAHTPSAVLTDADGTAFLLTDTTMDVHRYIMIPPKAPPPKASAKLVRTGVNDAEVRLSAGNAGAEVWYTWRLNGLDWSTVETAPDVHLKKLSPGKHRLEVRAFTPELVGDAKPVVLEWEIP